MSNKECCGKLFRPIGNLLVKQYCAWQSDQRLTEALIL